MVEVAVVVVIVGIISALAIVGYVRYRRHARMAEATNLIAMIEVDQEAYKTESGLYADVSEDITSYYPAPVPGKFATAWGGPCGNCNDAQGWTRLGVQPAGPVVYGYATIGDVGDSLHSHRKKKAGGGSIETDAANQCKSLGATDPYYLIEAVGDTDGDGVSCTVLAASCSTTLILVNQGE